MSNTNTGGSAFPSTNHGMMISMGMTLRDYFAAKAMQGMMISAPKEADEVIAELAYTMADEMLKAREA